jgi:hypothetical protein
LATEFPSLGWALVDWIEHYLVHGPGDVQGQEIELDDEYTGFVVKAYRVHPRLGEKIVRRGFLSRPKGRAKSELAGMLDCVEALGPCRFDHWAVAGEVSAWGYEYDEGEPVGKPLAYVEILNVATEEGQAGNTYDNAYYMLHPDTCSPELLADYGRIDVGLTRTNLPNRRGYIEPVTAANESKDGGKSTFIVADETHLWLPPAVGRFKLGLMHQTMSRNLLKRKVASGWMLETSTMYAEGEGSVAEGTHAYAKSPAGRNGKLLFDHRQADDGHDLSKRADRMVALREAYGPAAMWMPLGEIADSYDDPQVKPAEWERFWTNRPVPLEGEPVGAFPGWFKLATAPPESPLVHALGIATDRDQTWLSLGAVVEGDHPHLAITDRRRATDRKAFAANVARIQQERGCEVLIRGKNFIIPDLEDAGVALRLVDSFERAQAHADLATAIENAEVEHGDYPELNLAVSVASWRATQTGRSLDSKRDISALDAVALALHGAESSLTYDPLASVL